MDANSNPRFRIWDPFSKVMEYPQADMRRFLIGLDGSVFDGDGNIYDEKFKILRWTGLMTYLDDPIYEGDIIEYYLGTGFGQTGPYRATVVWNNFGWCFDAGGELSSVWQMEDIQVIGNIYEERPTN